MKHALLVNQRGETIEHGQFVFDFVYGNKLVAKYPNTHDFHYAHML